MLYLIGVGINEYESLSVKSIEILKNSHIIYLDNFTSYLSNDFALKIKTKHWKEFTEAEKEFLFFDYPKNVE